MARRALVCYNLRNAMTSRRLDTATDHHAGSAGARFDGFYFTYYAWRFS